MKFRSLLMSLFTVQGLAGFWSAGVADAAPVFTSLQPAKHGFKFTNDFDNLLKLPGVPGQPNIRTAGLCGGMSYTVADYFYAGLEVPQQTYRPAEGMPLQTHLYNRQVTSLVSNIDKWTEVILNPFGVRNSEFFKWGMQGTNGGRIEELRSLIDKGKVAVLGLKGANGSGNHQVLAYGYDLGRYKGDLGAYQGDFKIYILDPNFPNETRTLVANVEKEFFYYIEAPHKNYQTYFVDKNYSPVKPVNIEPDLYPYDGLVYKLVLDIGTAGDDMRGGNDNLNIRVHLKDGNVMNFDNVNRSMTWVSNYNQFVELPLSPAVTPENLARITFTTTSGGGVGGDNWDMSYVNATAIRATGATSIGSSPARRFTGDARTLTFGVSMPQTINFATNFNTNSAVNLIGADLRLPFPLAKASYTECQTACDVESSCLAFTYLPVGTKSPTRAMCTLKTSVVSAEKADTGVISGIKNRVGDIMYEPTADRMGSDYNSFNVNNFETCADSCSSDNSCQSFTYVRPGMQRPTAVCHLKNAIPTKTFVNEGILSGVKTRPKDLKVSVLPSTDLIGNDYANMPVANVLACAKICSDASACKAYTYVAAGFWAGQTENLCLLKNGRPNPTAASPLLTSGLKSSGWDPLF